MDNDNDYQPGEAFHAVPRRIYDGELGWAVNKKREHMARVVYTPAHENPAFDDARRGRGRDFATWIFSEEQGTREGLFASGLELLIDARLEPHAAVGLHEHRDTEEIYYIIDGSIEMTTVAADGREHAETLRPGDAHLVRRGQSHYGVAGPHGVRFLTIGLR